MYTWVASQQLYPAPHFFYTSPPLHPLSLPSSHTHTHTFTQCIYNTHSLVSFTASTNLYITSMASVSSEDCSDDRCGSYCLSADVSESESSSSFSGRRFDADSLSAQSPLVFAGNSGFPAPVMFPVVGGKDVVVWEDRTRKSEADLSGILFIYRNYFFIQICYF